MSARVTRRIRRLKAFVGEQIKLPRDGVPEAEYCTVGAPDGRIMLFPPDYGPVTILADQPGDWVYRWGDGTEKKFTVTSVEPAIEMAPPIAALPTSSLTSGRA